MMYKLWIAIMAAITLVTTLHATEIIIDQTKLQKIKTKNKVLQNPTLHLTGAIEKPDSYILKLEARSPRGSQLVAAVLDKTTSELYIGSAYDKDGIPIVFPIDANTIKGGVAFSYGKGDKDIYIVTDPECPYCIRFEKTIAGKLDVYRVHVILMPLSFHKKAPAMITWVMQGKDDAQRKKRFEEIMLKGSTEYKELIKDAKKPFVYPPDAQTYINRSNQTTMELKVRGTPAIYDSNFKLVTQDQLLNSLPKVDAK